jgi:glycolate oxidase subunit GlcD
VDRLVQQLRAALGEGQVISEPDELLVYECDGLTHYKARPRAVVFPRSTEEVSRVFRLLSSAGVACVARGAGTGLSGGALTLDGGVCVELSRMRRILKIDVANRIAVVETGVVNAHVSRAVAAHGLYYVPDPSSQTTCTIGGNIAENAGGIHCLKYGTTVDHVLSARVVLSDGHIVTLGGAGDERAGYDLLGLFIGSEGTFGIATEATLRLTPVAPAVRTLLADFGEVDAASRAVSRIIAEGIVPAALEMVDGATIRAVEQSVFAAGLPADAEAALLVELDGLEAGIESEVERVVRVCREAGARSVRLAADEAERRKLWAARKGAFGAMGRISPDLMLQDAVVPRSRLPEVLAETYRIGARYRLRLANVFHAGDGNLHPCISYDARDHDEVARVKEAGREIVETCVRAGGTITGEHGVGLDKREYLPLVFSEDALRAMLEVRAAFDPLGLCNPGKVIPTLKGCGEARAVAGTVSEISEKLDDEATAASVANPASIGASASSSNDAASLVGRERRAREPLVFDCADASTALSRTVGEQHVAPFEGEGGGLVATPQNFEAVERVLREACEMNWRVIPTGANLRTANHSTGPANRRIFLRTTALRRLVEHEPADLVATAEAGMTLRQFNEHVGRAGQWLPLDAPTGDGSTLGGLVGRGLGGPQSFGYGPPRRHVLGMKVALADGRVVRFGGRVVKNVAGYDLCKLFVGSRGTLGVILELTFKLRPRPQSERTLVVRSADLFALLAAARAIIAAPLFPVAAEVASPAVASALGLGAGADQHVLLLRFAGTRETVAHQVSRSREMFAQGGARIVVEELNNRPSNGQPSNGERTSDEEGVWRTLASSFLRDARLAWRADLPPVGLEAMLKQLHERGAARGARMWHAGAGSGALRLFETEEVKTDAALAELKRLRDVAREEGGSLVVEQAPADLARSFDSLGMPEETAALALRIKNHLDPRGLFCSL